MVPEVITTLQTEFVNTWLLAKDLDAIAARSGDAEIVKLCKLIKANYGYPVDSVLVAPDLRLLGHLNAHEPRAKQTGGYLRFLREGLAAARGETLPAEAAASEATTAPDGGVRAVVLTPEEPTGSVLDVIQRRPFGKPSMVFTPIDATAFADGGTIEIALRVGGTRASGRFELCAEVEGGMAPVRTLPQVGPGASDKLVHEFGKGAMFGLVAMPGPGTVEGDAIAFLATVTVRGR